VGTVIQDQQPRNPESQSRWDRFERADLFDQYRELRTQGFSERQVAKKLKVPRTTLQAWRLWHDTVDICPDVAEFFQSAPGLAFLHRLVIAFQGWPSDATWSAWKSEPAAFAWFVSS
jgi:hypothetical protein